MLNTLETKELKFFANKVSEVHGNEHNEFIEINKIVKDLDLENIDDSIF